MNKLKQTLEKVLKQEEAFLDVETGELNYIKIKDSADKIDEKLIALLAGNKELKEKFFSKIKDVYVFNINDFKFFLDESKIDNSYTKYANKIGLSDGSELLKNRSEVVLDFPFKDCVLEGGQSTEEGTDTYFEYEEEKTKTVKGEKVTEPAGYKEKQAKRKEVFFNQVLAHDEIDRLLEKKALVNWKRFSKESGKNGEAVEEIKRDESGLIKENLIIKGNNLLALHSLQSEFAGKVKLIYIDPPYYFEKTKKEDTFVYNTNFKLSTWLTFMKSRLTVAVDLLKDDGVIFVQINEDSQPYLKMLMDEIKDIDFVSNLSVKAKSGAGASGGGEDKKLKKNYENILIYGKKSFKTFKRIYQEEYLEDILISKRRDGKSYEYDKVLLSAGNSKESTKILSGSGKEIKVYKHTGYKISSVKALAKTEKVEEYEIYKKYFKQVFRTQDAQSSIRHKVVMATNSDGELYSINYTPRTGKHKNKPITLYYFKNEMVNFLTNVAVIEAGEIIKKSILGNLWTDIGWDGIANEGGVKLKSGKKPEKLLHRIVEMSSEPNDIVLDYHAGSGTTCGVAHKTGRQWIAIEQLDYAENNPEARMVNVISGDNTGISKNVDWKGGGEFIYCELAKWNEQAKEGINKAKDLPELVKLLDTLYEKYFLNYNVRIKDFKEKIIKEDNFKKLSLDEQKRMFLTMLDLNQMYVQESEMSDGRFGISKEDQKLTKEFYKK